MFFRIQSTSPKLDLAKYRAKKQVRLNLALYSFTPTDMILSRYLQEQYGVTLKVLCLEIINKAKFSSNMMQEIIITIPEEKLNEMAKIITYGTGKVAGSRILKDIFTLKKGKVKHGN